MPYIYVYVYVCPGFSSWELRRACEHGWAAQPDGSGASELQEAIEFVATLEEGQRSRVHTMRHLDAASASQSAFAASPGAKPRVAASARPGGVPQGGNGGGLRGHEAACGGGRLSQDAASCVLQAPPQSLDEAKQSAEGARP